MLRHLWRRFTGFIKGEIPCASRYQAADVGADYPDNEGLEVSLSDMLRAFDLAGPYATGKSNTAKLENRKELALAIIDWCLMESDRGLKLLELTSELAQIRRSDPGATVSWPR